MLPNLLMHVFLSLLGVTLPLNLAPQEQHLTTGAEHLKMLRICRFLLSVGAARLFSVNTGFDCPKQGNDCWLFVFLTEGIDLRLTKRYNSCIVYRLLS